MTDEPKQPSVPPIIDVRDKNALAEAVAKAKPGEVVRVTDATHLPNVPPLLKLKRLHEAAIEPIRGSSGSFGWDLSLCTIDAWGRPNNVLIPARGTRVVDTGWAIEAPPGYGALILSRSGLAKDGVFVANSPGLIDADYRGEIKVILANLSHESRYFVHGNRIAQLVLFPLPTIDYVVVEELSETTRDVRGLGSTGL